MNVNTGSYFPIPDDFTLDEAIRDDHTFAEWYRQQDPKDVVEVHGTEEQVGVLAEKVRAAEERRKMLEELDRKRSDRA